MVEPEACPSLTKGKYTFDYMDTDKTFPMMKMHTLGHAFVPPSIHAGGLRYHGMAPQVSALYDHGDIEAVAVHQIATFDAALQFARTEGIVAAPESAHGIRIFTGHLEFSWSRSAQRSSPARPIRQSTAASCWRKTRIIRDLWVSRHRKPCTQQRVWDAI